MASRLDGSRLHLERQNFPARKLSNPASRESPAMEPASVRHPRAHHLPSLVDFPPYHLVHHFGLAKPSGKSTNTGRVDYLQIREWAQFGRPIPRFGLQFWSALPWELTRDNTSSCRSFNTRVGRRLHYARFAPSPPDPTRLQVSGHTASLLEHLTSCGGRR